MKTRILALLLVVMISPFIGGAIQFGETPTAEEAAPLASEAGQAMQAVPMVDQALIPGEAPAAGESEIVKGPDRVICGTPEIPGEKLVPGCYNYLPEKADGIIIVDKDRFNFDAMKKIDEAAGMNIFAKVKNGMDPAGIINDRTELFDKLVSICAACNLRVGAEGQAPATPVPGVAGVEAPPKDKDFPQKIARWCKDAVVIYELKDPPTIREIIKDVAPDENGYYPANNGWFAWQSSDQKFIIIGTADSVKSAKDLFVTPRENAGREFAAFAPAGMLISESSALLRTGFKPIIDLKVMALPFQVAAAEADVKLVAGIDFGAVVNVGAGIYKIKDNAEELAAKSVLTMSYEEIAKLALKEKENRETTAYSLEFRNSAAIDAMNNTIAIEKGYTAVTEMSAGQPDKGPVQIRRDLDKGYTGVKGFDPAPPIEKQGEEPVRYRTDLPLKLCGNGQIDPGENCGEPGLQNCFPGTVCADCRCSICGNGYIDPGEECDVNHPCAGSSHCDMSQCRCHKEIEHGKPDLHEVGCDKIYLEPGEECGKNFPCADPKKTCDMTTCRCVNIQE